MRLLLTGGSGYLGRHILAQIPEQWRTWATYHSQPLCSRPGVTAVPLDLIDGEATHEMLCKIRPDVVLHTAITRHEADFDAVIVRGSAHLAASAAELGARFIHLSTDVIFDGSAASYNESAAPHPAPAPGQADALTPYARAKARAEVAVRAAHPHATLVRTSLIYGFEPLDHSTRWLVGGLQQGEPVTLYTDQIRCPIYAPDLAAALIELVSVPFSGVLNLAGPVALNRYDFGLLLCQTLGIDTTDIIAIPSPPDSPHPNRLVLDDTLARKLLRTYRRSPREVLV